MHHSQWLEPGLICYSLFVLYEIREAIMYGNDVILLMNIFYLCLNYFFNFIQL